MDRYSIIKNPEESCYLPLATWANMIYEEIKGDSKAQLVFYAWAITTDLEIDNSLKLLSAYSINTSQLLEYFVNYDNLKTNYKININKHVSPQFFRAELTDYPADPTARIIGIDVGHSGVNRNGDSFTVHIPSTDSITEFIRSWRDVVNGASSPIEPKLGA